MTNPTDFYQVDTGELASMARTLASLAEDLRAALDGVRQVSLSDNAYGQNGRNAADVTRQLCDAGQDALQAGVDALEWASDTMNKTAGAYDDQERQQVAALNGIELPTIGSVFPGNRNRPNNGEAMV